MKPGGPKELQSLVTGKENAHHPIEATEVVHVGMGNKDMADPKNLARRQKVQVAQVKEQCPLLKEEIDVESRVIERVIDEASGETGVS